jgi:hypothetical protein
MYSSVLTENSRTFTRTACAKSIYYYEAIQVNVVESGCYGLSSNSTIDTDGYIYEDSFDPFNPTRNLLSQNNDNLNDTQFKFIIHLQVNTTYVLVVTMGYPIVKEAFSIVLSGPNNVNLNRIGEYL